MPFLLALLALLASNSGVCSEGAIAFGSNRAFVTWNHPTRQQARAAALADCNKHAHGCYLKHEFRNTCVAGVPTYLFHTGPPLIGFGPTKAAAKADAEKICAYVNCRATLTQCDTIAETPTGPKHTSQREPTATQSAALTHLQDTFLSALKDAAFDIVIGLPLGAFYTWAPRLGRASVEAPSHRDQTRDIAFGALSAAALVGALDIFSGKLPAALLLAMDYFMMRHIEEAGFLILFTLLPLGLLFTFGSLALFAVLFAGAVYACYKLVKDFTAFLHGLWFLLKYLLRT